RVPGTLGGIRPEDLNRVGPCGTRISRHRREPAGLPAGLVGDAVHDGPPGVAVVERHGVLPPLPKRALEVADDGPPDPQLEVVPRGPRTVARVEVDGLGF